MYGDDAQALRIQQANPGSGDTPVPGSVVVVPVNEGTPQDLSGLAAASGENEVAVLIGGNRFRFWETFRIFRGLDTVDIVELGAPFDADLAGFRETFVPFSYRPLEVTVGGELLFKGTMVGVQPIIENEQALITISGYSLPGVFADVTMPASSFPLEFNCLTLQEIAETCAFPFGIDVEFEAEQGVVFETEAIEPGVRIASFLTRLAKARNVIMSNTIDGKLLFLQSAETGNPSAQLVVGEPPILSVTPFFSPQEYYSHITGIPPIIIGFGGEPVTTVNPRLQGVLRPLTFEGSDSVEGDLLIAVGAKEARMFANAAFYSVTVATWRDPSGNLWEPNKTVSLHAPNAMVYEPYEFIIRSVEFNKDPRQETARLNLVMPGSFSGRTPESLPWD